MKQLITTPIYYVNDIPHIGHAYTTIIADMLKKHRWLLGNDVFLLTGTDEHGQKIEQSAQSKGKSPQAYTDEISAVFRSLWDELDINYDYFIRTTDSYHKETVVRVFEQLYANGDIYLGEYEGDYCVSCESFFLHVDSRICPECPGNKPLIKIKEESYFFALSKYQQRLLEWYASHDEIILPQYRKNEVARFVEQGLQDLSISRTSCSWGIPLPTNNTSQKRHIAYVWLDALFNYVSALGFYQQPYGAPSHKSTESSEADRVASSTPSSTLISTAHNEAHKRIMRKEYWEHATHIVGKDILRFHAVYWPAFLMSLGLPLPKHIYTHGWWMRDGEKMSKSLGNVINPREFAKAYGIEALRYYLLRETPFGQDGDFSQRGLCERINNDLANDLGNLLHRTQGISDKYTSLHIQAQAIAQHFIKETTDIAALLAPLPHLLAHMQTKPYIEQIWKILHLGNTYIAHYEPWNLYKKDDIQSIHNLLALLANLLLKVANVLYPIMPRTATQIASAFSHSINQASYAHFITHNHYDTSFTLHPIAPLFTKIEHLLIPESSPITPQSTHTSATSALDSSPSTCDIHTAQAIESSTSRHEANPSKHASLSLAPKNTISIDTFNALDIRVGEVLSATHVPKSNKLLRLEIDIGEEEPRIVLSGIAQFYQPSELIGTQVCVIANLTPAKIMGQYSYGMVLASSDEHGLSLIRIEGKRANGSIIR